jgi:acetyl-CoA acetyltransferase
MTDLPVRDRTAVVGVGNAPFAWTSERSAELLALEAVRAAVHDAGLAPDEIDGVVGHSFDPVREYSIVDNLGLRDLSFFAESQYGNGCGAVGLAAMAVATGRARNVVAFRAMKSPGGHTYHHGSNLDAAGPTLYGNRAYYAPFGLLAVLHWAALVAQRYLHRYGADPLSFGWVTVACRRHAADNPAALYFGQPLTIDDYADSPMVASPLRTLDGNLPNDAASAVVVSSAEAAVDMARPPVFISAASWATGPAVEVVTCYQRPEIEVASESRALADRLFAEADVDRGDVDFVEVYDHVSALALLALEGLGFCEPGEGAAFVEGADRITVGGELPLNTHGGHLGEGYVQTMNHVVEAVRQLRGEAAVQVSGAEVGMVVGGSLAPTSGLVLRR